MIGVNVSQEMALACFENFMFVFCLSVFSSFSFLFVCLFEIGHLQEGKNESYHTEEVLYLLLEVELSSKMIGFCPAQCK